jgi:ribosome-binding protein aMBF1 (putative translation factor)
MDNTYGCDICATRKDRDKEIHWITSSYGVCDECYSKLSKTEIEELEERYE